MALAAANAGEADGWPTYLGDAVKEAEAKELLAAYEKPAGEVGAKLGDPGRTSCPARPG